MDNRELPFDPGPDDELTLPFAGWNRLAVLVAAGNRLAGLLDASLRGRVSAHDIDRALKDWDEARDASGVVV